MKESHLIQTPSNVGPNATLLECIRNRCHRDKFDQVFVSMAYVSVSGVRGLLSAFTDDMPKNSKWIVGLDDCTSQPGAIDNLTQIPEAQLKIASLGEHSLRFHPKVIYLTSSQQPNLGLMVVGSANLTSRGLTRNVEAVVFLQTETSEDKVKLDELWSQHWELGKEPTKQEIEDYRAAYQKARKHTRKSQPPIKATIKVRKSTVRLVLQDDDAEIDPARARTCWIECGSVTAMGRELELKAEQGLFFGLAQHGGPTKVIHFQVSNGNTVNLKMKYQGNHMWRLQMTKEVPEVATGLRPILNGKLQRSPYVAVFTKTKEVNTFVLRFIKITSKKFNALKTKTKKHGTLGQTSARVYGWI